jgi:predicted RNA-binding Zn ribbon-like protein
MSARPDPFFIADDLAVDFLNSIAAPWGQDIEWLANGADLIDWLARSQAVASDEVRQIGGSLGSEDLHEAAVAARSLREWFRGFVSRHAGRPLARGVLSELGPLNGLLKQDDAYRQIGCTEIAESTAGDPALRWQVRRRWSKAEALLMPIAEAMGELVCQKDFSLVRRCEGSGCTLWFLDVSKGHARRWCSMAVCGNRAKVAAHRARTRRVEATRSVEK